MPARRSARIEKKRCVGRVESPVSRARSLPRPRPRPAAAERPAHLPPAPGPRPGLGRLLRQPGRAPAAGGARLGPNTRHLGCNRHPESRPETHYAATGLQHACNTRIVGATRILGRATRQPCSGNTLLCAAVAGPRLAPVTPLSLWRVRRWPARTLSWAHGSAACSSSSATHSLSPRSAALCSAVLPSCGPPVALPHGNAY